MRTLNDLSLDHFKKLINFSLDEMTGFIPERVDIAKLSTDLPEESFLHFKKEIKSIFLLLVYSSDIKDERILKRLDEDKATYILTCFNSRKLDIALTVLKQQNGFIKPVLDNFDWNLKWVLGTSACTTMRYPLLKLDLLTLHYEQNEPIKKNISLELTKTEVDLLLSALDDTYNTQ